jgi:putative DNA primase/helicase
MKRSIAEHNAMASVLDDRERGPIFPELPDSPDISGLGPRDKVILTCGTDLTPEPYRWLWQYWLAMGKLHILAGAPGQGKTTIALAMAATITIGGRWPDGSRCAPGNVLIWSGEDDPADTLVPRLMAAGADRARCYFIEGARRGGEVVPFDPARDLGQLLEAIEKIGGISLLVIDPVVSAVTGDSHKNTEVRRALQPLVDLAAKCDCAVLGITHFAKGGQGTDPAQRVVGSVAFTAVARVVMVAAKVKGDEEGQDTRILARSKSNIGPDDGGFQYHLEQSEPLPGIHASHIAWGKAVEGTARELLTDPDDGPQDDASDAVELLRAELDTVRWTSCDEAAKPLKAAGFSKKQIWAASKKVGVMRKKDGMKGGWMWRLRDATEVAFRMNCPEDSIEDSEDSYFGNVEPSDSSESSAAMESSVTEVL